MSIWFNEVTLEGVKASRAKTMVDHIGIEFTRITENTLEARMPVDERTRQPLGIMHGGASAALAETVASIAANLTIDLAKSFCVGLDLNTSHIKMVKEGFVYATASPIHIGSQTQIWQVRTVNEKHELVAVSRMTMIVLERKTK
jgi:1,4-dihydroxy-2-naphthoyl-CoA hydrolase